MNPFIAFCLYVAARVFVQYLKSRPGDATVKSSLQFLLSAMQALKGKNPLTESFLVQLDVDLEGSGIESLSSATKASLAVKRAMGGDMSNIDALRCSHLHDPRQSQTPGAPILGEGSSPQPLQSVNGTPMDLSQLYSSTQYTASMPSRSKDGARTHSLQGLIPTSDYGEGMVNTTNDMDTSPDASDRQNSTSDHPTPSTNSNKGSSHTSFTPPNHDQEQHATANTGTPYPNHNNITPGMSPSTAANTFFQQNAASFSQFFPTAPDTPKDPAGVENPFGMPASWDYNNAQTGGTGMTPTATGGGTGMSPLNDGQWSQMLEGMGWNGWQEMGSQR